MVTLAAWADLDALCEHVLANGQSFGFFQKHLRQIAERHRWVDWGDRKNSDRRALIVYRAISMIHYSELRLAQLRESGCALWVYRCSDPLCDCAEKHIAFNGLVLPKEHVFWDIWLPPNSYDCRCYVVGASSIRSALRLGGDPDKPLPERWEDPVRGPHQRFAGVERPALREIVRAALTDEWM